MTGGTLPGLDDAGAGDPAAWAGDDAVAHLLADLDEAQRLAVTSPAAPLCIRAGPGSGKTRVLTRRIAYRIAGGDCEARFCVAVTFTQRAAAELRTRLTELGIRDRIAVGTFHGLASRQLRRHAEDDDRAAPDILPDRSRLLEGLAKPNESLRAVEAELDWCAARSIAPADYPAAASAAGRRTPLAPGRLADVMARYAATKRRLGVVDFGDLLRLAAERLESDAAVAEAWRWSRRHFFVDELQDLTPAQLRLLRAWLGDRSDLCAVGDPDQAIFGWGGADARAIEGFAALFAGGTVVDLRHNYRCTPGIVALSGALREGGPATAAGDVAAADPGPFAEPAPLIVEYPTATEEAAGTAVAVRRARAPGDRWADQAVLVRTRRQVGELIEAMESAGVPARAADPDAPGDPDDRDAVCVSTMHAAKGLEWPVVHVAGLEEGLVPVAGAERGAALDEERRLLYVALTRARRRLHLSWARERDHAGRPTERRPCRWLSALDGVGGGAGATEGPRNPGARPAGQRPPTMADPPDPLVVALRTWRDQAAHAARVEPTAVLSDRDVAAIAANRPATVAELGIITGLGASRLDRFGPQLVDLIAEHAV